MYKKLVLAVFAALALCAGARTVVVDGDDRSPLIAASVFDANGTLVALTDTCGAFSARLPVAWATRPPRLTTKQIPSLLRRHHTAFPK